jgi:hypothetical protein
MSACVCVSILKFPFVYFFGAVPGFNLRASCLLGRCSTTWATPLTPSSFCIFALIIFQRVWVGLDSDCVIFPPMACHNPPDLLIGMDLTHLLLWLSSVLVFASVVAGIIEICHCAQPHLSTFVFGYHLCNKKWSGVIQVVEHLPNKPKALSVSPNAARK